MFKVRQKGAINQDKETVGFFFCKRVFRRAENLEEQLRFVSGVDSRI